MNERRAKKARRVVSDGPRRAAGAAGPRTEPPGGSAPLSRCHKSAGSSLCGVICSGLHPAASLPQPSRWSASKCGSHWRLQIPPRRLVCLSSGDLASGAFSVCYFFYLKKKNPPKRPVRRHVLAELRGQSDGRWQLSG